MTDAVKKIAWILLWTTLALACRVSLYDPYFQAAEKYFVSGAFNDAIRMYYMAIEENKNRPEAYFGLAMAYYEIGYLEEAQFAFEKTLEKDPLNVLAIERLAAVNIDLGNPDTAAYLCRLVRAMEPGFVPALNTMGHACFALGQVDSAQAAFSAALSSSREHQQISVANSNPRSFASDAAEALNGLGEVEMSRGLYAHALDYFGAAISGMPNWDTPWFNKALAYEALGNYPAAQVAYQRTIDLAPRNVVAMRSYARLLSRRGKETEALDLYLLALKADPSDKHSYYGLADIYERRGEYEKAAEAYRGVLDVAPDDPIGYVRAGRLDLRLAKYDDALEMFRSALDLDPASAESLNGTGEALRAKGSLAEAQSAFEKAIRTDSTFAKAFTNLGALLLDSNRIDEGISHLKKAARLGDLNAREMLRARGFEAEIR